MQQPWGAKEEGCFRPPAASRSPRLAQYPSAALSPGPARGSTDDAGEQREERATCAGAGREEEALVVPAWLEPSHRRRPGPFCPRSLVGCGNRPRCQGCGCVGRDRRACVLLSEDGRWGLDGKVKGGGVGLCAGRRKTTHRVLAQALGPATHWSRPPAFVPALTSPLNEGHPPEAFCSLQVGENVDDSSCQLAAAPAHLARKCPSAPSASGVKAGSPGAPRPLPPLPLPLPGHPGALQRLIRPRVQSFSLKDRGHSRL